MSVQCKEIYSVYSTAIGETSHAKELISLLLASTSATQPSSQPSPTVNPTTVSTVTATIVTKPPAIPSVQAFNAQLVVGGKDEALRKAADIFKTAAESMERGQVRGDKYWVDALKIRRANWGLIPAPLPFGSATGKGAEKTSKDFLISFGLEECMIRFWYYFCIERVSHSSSSTTTKSNRSYGYIRNRLRCSCLSSSTTYPSSRFAQNARLRWIIVLVAQHHRISGRRIARGISTSSSTRSRRTRDFFSAHQRSRQLAHSVGPSVGETHCYRRCARDRITI